MAMLYVSLLPTPINTNVKMHISVERSRVIKTTERTLKEPVPTTLELNKSIGLRMKWRYLCPAYIGEILIPKSLDEVIDSIKEHNIA